MNECCKKARAGAFSEVLSLFSWRKTKPQICQEIEDKMLKAIMSQSAEGTKAGGAGG